ncbi:hypothetical protein C4573_00275 [Candidatus Woesearchaeota archaeon]|nr:MAG: hypothetical protein C4573_00275 [Candidatus Woesearchaeota archaeon]
MKLAHQIHVRVFCYPEDNAENIEKALLFLFPFDLEKEKITLKKTKAEGFHDRQIIIYEVTLIKDKHCNLFLEQLNKNIEEKSRLLPRIDENFDLFMRFDKDALLEGKYKLTESGNCFHIKISLAVFPRNKEQAIALVKRMFT